jgi:hypothetical protein
LVLSSSISGSGPSLLGAGVSEEPEVVPAGLAWKSGGAGVVAAVRAGRAAGEPVEGVFWKNPKSVLCPPEEDDFFNAGVEVGVEDGFLATMMAQRPLAAYLVGV